jgi:chromosome segregation ATPase
MATSVPKDLPEIVKFFEMLGQRHELREALEAEVTAHEQQLAGQRQEAQDLKTEKAALLSVIRELMEQLEDLTSPLPKARVAVEDALLPLRREQAELQEDIRREQAQLRTLKEQTSDALQQLEQIKAMIVGGQAQVRARSFAPAPSMNGPAIISPNLLADDHPLEPEQEASA